MKRIVLTAVFLLAFAAAPLFSQDNSLLTSINNNQKIYPIDSEIYQAIKALYIARGLALPSTAGPWSGDELLKMLERVNSDTLRLAEQVAYDFALDTLHADTPPFRFSGSVNLEMSAHTNTTDFIGADDFILPWNRHKPLVAVDMEAWIGDIGYGFFELPVGNNFYSTMYDVDGKLIMGSTIYGKEPFATNIIMMPPATGSDFNMNWPFRAFVSAGGSGWSLQIGRERLSWGPGESGNFLLGSQVDYHNSVRTTFYNKAFKWTYNVSSFPWPGNYYTTGGDEPVVLIPSSEINNNQRNKVTGINLFIAHRLEFRALGDKLGLVLNEGLMYQSETATIEPLVLIPSMFLHNAYIAANANSILTFEANYSPIPALNIYGQVAIDEFSVGFTENVPGKDDGAYPNGYAWMLGAKTAFPLGQGMFSASLEGAYTDPYLYLRVETARNVGFNIHTYGTTQVQRRLDYVVANRYYDPRGDFYVENYLGYRWGGDAIVANLNADYRVLGKWNVRANLMVMVHGTTDKWTTWTWVDNGDGVIDPDIYGRGDETPYYETPSSAHPSGNYADANAGARNAASVTTALSLMGEWQLASLPSLDALPVVHSMSVYGQADLVIIKNPGNIKSNTLATDLQFTLGISYSF